MSTQPPIFVAGATDYAASVTTLTITHGLTILEDDVLIATVHYSSSGTLTSNGGLFTETFQEENPSTTTSQIGIFERVAGASEGTTYQFDVSGGAGRLSVHILQFRNVDTANIWDVVPSATQRGFENTDTDLITPVALTTIAEKTIGLGICCQDNPTPLFSGYTGSYINEVEHGTGMGLAEVTKEYTSSGVKIAFNATASVSDNLVYYHAALKGITTSPDTILGPVIIRTPWTKQPPVGTKINWNHPLAQGLVFFTPLNESSGDVIDAVTGSRGVDVSDGTSSVSRKMDGYGRHIDLTRGGDTEIVGFDFASRPEWELTNQAMTIVTHSKRTGAIASPGGSRIFTKRDSGFSNAWGLNHSDDFDVRFNISAGGGNNNVIVTTGSTLNVDLFAAAKYDGSNKFVYARYNGPGNEVLSNSSAETGNLEAGTEALAIGHMSNNARAFTGQIYFAAFYNRVLTEAEIVSLWDNPWQIFVPETIFIPEPDERKFVSVDVPWDRPTSARLFDDAVPNYLTYGASPIVSLPVTMACWAFDNDATQNDRCMMQIQDKDLDTEYLRLGIENVASLFVRAQSSTSGDIKGASSTIGRPLNTWFHACGVWGASGIGRTVYLNGANSDTQGSTTVPLNLDSIDIGREGDSTADDEWSGGIMWPAVWDVELTDEEVADLARGTPPWKVRPQNLVFFAPLDGRPDDYRNLIKNVVPTVAGSLQHMAPPLVQPSKPQKLHVPIAEVGHEFMKARVKAPRIELRAALLDDGNPDHFDFVGAPVNTAPLTMAIWFFDDESAINDRCLMQIADVSIDDAGFRFGIGTDSTPSALPIFAYVMGSSDAWRALSTINRTINTWHHACAIWADVDDRRAFIDGGNKGTQGSTATHATPGNLDVMGIGFEYDSTPSDYWSGGLLWPAVWNVALTDLEVALLGSGVPPWKIRPSALRFCARLDGSSGALRDIVSGRYLDTVGSPTFMQAPDSKLLLPRQKEILVPRDTKLPDIAVIETPW